MADKMATCLWFDGGGEEAARFYTELFPDGELGHIMRSPSDWPGGKAGDAVLVSFRMMGQAFSALNGGSGEVHSNAVSFQVFTEDQAETDRYWDALTSNGGKEMMCSWCQDRWGVRWQITPRALLAGMSDPDPAVAARVQQAMFTMRKIDIAAIEAARAGD